MIQWTVLLPGFLIMEYSMSMTECTSLNILTTQANMISFHYQSSKSKCFTNCPVNALPSFNHLSTLLINPFNCSMWLEILRKCSDCLTNILQDLRLNPSVTDSGKLLRGLETLPVCSKPIPPLWHVILAGFKLLIEDRNYLFVGLVNVFFRHLPSFKKFAFVNIKCRRMTPDNLVHFRLCK
uniref:Uncharacterized protein n=1 Tax=Opuntia streptacantha TaxID=393608 RepID=A0A7C8Z5D8_OPUST